MEKFTVSRNDNVYEAWPDVVLTTGGKLICIYSECTHHGDRSMTCLVMRESLDRGRSWGPAKELTERTKGMPYWNCARIMRLPDDRLAITADLISQPHEEGGVVHLWLGDAEGTQWNGPVETAVRGIVPDKLLALPSGRWLLSAHHRHPVHKFLVQELWHSEDEGASWTGPVTVAAQEGLHLCETNLVRMPGGEIVAFLRENSGEGYDGYKCVSLDEGLTWSEPVRMPLPGLHRPTAGLLRSGRVLITYRFMQGGKGWLGSWTQNFFAALTDVESCLAGSRREQCNRILPIDYDRSPVSDLGYSGWVQFEDGEIYVVQYIVDDEPNGQIRGYSLREEEFGFTPA